MIEILNLRKTKEGYLANGYISLLSDNVQVLKWIADGNEVMPMFTYIEIEAQLITEKVSEAQQLLNNTQFKFGDDYDKKNTPEWLELKYKRQEAREFIRANDVPNP